MRKVANTSKENKTEGKEVMQKSKVSPMIILVSILLVILIAVGIILIVVLTRKDEPVPQGETSSPVEEQVVGRGTVITEENVEEALDELNAVDPKYNQYTAKMNFDWVFDRWDVPSDNAKVENIESNEVTVYFDLILQETNELVYSSPFIPAGSKLENFALAEEVPAGEYPAIVTYHLVDENNNDVSELSMSVTLTILG